MHRERWGMKQVVDRHSLHVCQLNHARPCYQERGKSEGSTCWKESSFAGSELTMNCIYECSCGCVFTVCKYRRVSQCSLSTLQLLTISIALSLSLFISSAARTRNLCNCEHLNEGQENDSNEDVYAHELRSITGIR